MKKIFRLASIVILVAAGVCAGVVPPVEHHACGAEAEWREVPLAIVPTPKKCLASGREFRLEHNARILITAPDRPTIQVAAGAVRDWFHRKGFSAADFASLGSDSEADLCVVLEGGTNGLATAGRTSGGYRIRIAPRGQGTDRPTAMINGEDDLGALYGCYTFLKSLKKDRTGLRIPEIRVDDEPALGVRGLSPQWAWYIGNRGPYGAALWRLPQWQRLLDLMAEFRLNMLALCTYGTFPMRLEGHESRCAVDLPFEIWDPDRGMHTIRWTHPAYEDDFLDELVGYAHQRGIRVLIYTCMNLQDEAGSQQWASEKDVAAYCDILQQILRRYGVDGFIFESGEFHLRHPDDIAKFGEDEWSRMKADLYLTRIYDEAIRTARPDAQMGLVDHYLFNDWQEKGIPQRTGLERWMPQLPPKTLMAYVASPDAYDVFPPERIWTYVFGPKGGLKPTIQLHLADCCDVPRAKNAAGAYYVTYDFSPHEVDYLCFAESAWGNYGPADQRGFVVHSSEPGVGGPISGRVWDNIAREFYGEGCGFGDGLLTAGKGTWPGMWDAEGLLARRLADDVVRPLGLGDFAAAERKLAEVKAQEEFTEEGLRRMLAGRHRGPSAMVTEYPIEDHVEKAIHLVRVQRSWLQFVRRAYETAFVLARNAAQPGRCADAIEALRTAGISAHSEIRDALDKAYFHYPHDKLGKFEFLRDPTTVVSSLAELPMRVRLATDRQGKQHALRNVAQNGRATADSNYAPSHYGPQYTIDGQPGSQSRGVWVSAETDGPHWLEVAFAGPQEVWGLVVQWVRAANCDWAPRDYEIQVLSGGTWQTVSQARDNREASAVVKLEPPMAADHIRIQIRRGSPSRPRLGSVAEVEVLVAGP